jgi:hypothetical protein
MKIIGVLVAATLLLGLVSFGFVTAGRLDNDIADAELRAVVGEYQPLADALERAEPYYEYASRVPGVGGDAVNEVRARKAALQYWQRQYSELVANPTEPFAAIPPENVDLQFLVAGAVYRQAIARATDRATTIEALDAAIDAYRTVLKNADRHEDAAYNYEYLARLKMEITKGQRKAAPNPEQAGPHGTRGKAEIQTEMGEFKVYIPLESGERTKSEGEAGKAAPIKRKG